MIPVCNGGELLEQAVASVYAQTRLPSQVIVINNGSTDDTEDRLRQLSTELPPSFSWRSKAHGVHASARNFGLALAEGTHVAFLDHDDLWHPEKLERQVQHFGSDPDLALSFTGYYYSYDGYRETPGRANMPEVIRHETWDPNPDQVLDELLAGHTPVGPMSTVMIHRDALARLPPLDESLLMACDVKMYLELVVRGMKMDLLPDVLVEYRWHGTNMSRDVGAFWEDLCLLLDSFYNEHASELPDPVRNRARSWRGHWHLQTAIDARRHGDPVRAREHIWKAARAWPRGIRPGWVRMLGVGSAPGGPWP